MEELQENDLYHGAVVKQHQQSYSFTIVLLHPREYTARSFHDYLYTNRLIPAYERMVKCRLVFPQARLRGQHSFTESEEVLEWFHDPNPYDIRSYEDASEQRYQGLEESIKAIRGLLELEAARFNGRWDRVFLAGFGSGGAVALHTLLNLDLPIGRTLCGVMIFVARVPFTSTKRTLEEMRNILGSKTTTKGVEMVKNTPILLEYCTDFPIADMEWHGRDVRDMLKGFGANPEFKWYLCKDFWRDTFGWEDASAFIQRVSRRTGRARDEGVSGQGHC